MELEKYLNTQKCIKAYKIFDNSTVYYSTNEDYVKTSSNESKFWGKLFDLSYQKMERLSDAVSSTEVWKNSYDGSNFSELEMNEWLNISVSRINRLIFKDCNVLEIGCGNGLIFNSIIENVSSYTGTDIAEKGLKLIANSKKGKSNANKIQLYQLDALNIDNIPNSKYNLIIINSVAQYFPSLDYIFNVLKKLENYASSNCLIFLGDIRSFELQNLIYFDILNTKEPNLNNNELKDKINFLKNRENETFYHNNLFNILPKLFDFISYHTIELKNGKYFNELNKFRYDVTLVCNSKHDHENVSIISVDWTSFEMPEEEIISLVQKLKKNEIIEIINIPNERFTNLCGKYNELFNSENFLFSNNSTKLKNTMIPSVSFFTVLAEKENVHLQTKFNNDDFFKFNAYLSKKLNFNIPSANDGINLQLLSNKLIEKKSEKDKELIEQINILFPGIEFIKVSNFLLK